MPMRRLMMIALLSSAALEASLPAFAGPLHHQRGYFHHVDVRYGPRIRHGRLPVYAYPLAGTVGTAIPPSIARFMGYPYNVPGYRYEYADACLLRVGGPFGPGPSAAPCPFGLDRPF